MLYFAYGMNTNQSGMRARCPGARSIGPAQLLDHRFRFAVHADVEPVPGSVVDGVLWNITDQCLESLDVLEGYPFYYNRAPLQVTLRGEHSVVYCEAMTYFMVDGHEDSLPSQHYFHTIIEGYAEHRVPTQQLSQAIIRLESVAEKQHQI